MSYVLLMYISNAVISSIIQPTNDHYQHNFGAKQSKQNYNVGTKLTCIKQTHKVNETCISFIREVFSQNIHAIYIIWVFLLRGKWFFFYLFEFNSNLLQLENFGKVLNTFCVPILLPLNSLKIFQNVNRVGVLCDLVFTKLNFYDYENICSPTVIDNHYHLKFIVSLEVAMS